jgi:tetratricopeptide (TPR) repeat protein/mono/diheme cytochrome c family protein
VGALLLASTSLVALAAVARDETTEQTGPTYTRDVAPILFKNCATCHRPGEMAPFSLLTYADARSHARQIADVTAKRFMPPWLPEPGIADYQGMRRLTDDEIATLANWAKRGAPEGDAADLPPKPEWKEGWQLGEPDLVLQFPEAYVLQAEGLDVFRNFVLPVPVEGTRYVRAIEFRPGNPRVVHHAVMGVDRTNGSRQLDMADEEIGFGGMKMGTAEFPDGAVLAWTPGHLPYPGSDDVSWRLERGTDFIVQLHLHPSGKPERVQPSIGFYFNDRAPTQQVSGIFLQSSEIDIPPGATDYTVEDTYKLPVDLDVFSVYPHAHYVGKDVQAFATLPDGTTRWLLRIKDWNFNWQDEYRFVEPLHLPTGSVVTMRWSYDNSTNNVRNPNSPPARIVAGNQTTDEMANLYLGVLPRNEGELRVLRESLLRRDLALDPGNWVLHYNLGLSLQTQGKLDDAAEHLRRAIELEPSNANAYTSLGNVLQLGGRLELAVATYQEALRIDPQHGEALFNLALAYQALGRHDEAIKVYRQALSKNPNDPEVHVNLGNALAAQGKHELALQHYAEALRVAPTSVEAHVNRATVLAELGRLEEAIAELHEAQRLAPDSPDVRRNLEQALKLKDELDQAYAMVQRSLALMQKAETYYAAGQLDQAVSTAEEALRLAQQAQADEVIQPIGERLEFYKRAKENKSGR